MEELKTDLKIQLFAGETLVLETKDPDLWRRVFSLMSQKGSSTQDDQNYDQPSKGNLSSSQIGKFASKLEISEAEVEGALSPQLSGPYLSVAPRYYEVFRKNFPAKGMNSMNATKLVATALAVWFQEAQLGEVRTKHIEEVLKDLGVEDKNIHRTITNADWLRIKSGVISLNPAEISRAYEVLRLFCTKRPPGG